LKALEKEAAAAKPTRCAVCFTESPARRCSFACLSCTSRRISAAADAGDRIIYNSATGALLFDVDGVGGTVAVQFVTLDTGLVLSNADFTVI
jgi:hypothetical protein